MGKTIGIDLGTTNSCAAVVEGGRPVIIPNETGGRTTPSVVAFTESGERLVGENALRQASVNSAGTVSSVKRHMGTDWTMEAEGRQFTPQEISAMILRRLRENAESYLGCPVTDAVITVPAYFNDIQRQATKDAGRIAGLNVKRIINEPTSAALAYGLDNGMPQRIMVYDLGGGTFDVSIIEIGDGVIEVLATSGDNHLGGDDFDKAVADFLAQKIQEQCRVNVRTDASAMQRVREASEQAKKELSVRDSALISLPYLTNGRNGMLHFEYTLTRACFDELTRNLVERTAIPVHNALTDAGLAPTELGRVLLVGGSTRIPAVQDKVRQLTGLEPSRNINPDECVALGAAIQGDTLSGGRGLAEGYAAGEGILLLDVTPLSLSIETVGGVATRVVERNSTLPIHYSRVFTTAQSYQRSVEIHVLQGERPMARDNKTIGRFHLNGIERAPAGVPQIEVTFDIDSSGILQVAARDLKTGKNQSITITANNKMSEEDIRQAIHDAEQYASSDSLRRHALDSFQQAQDLLVLAEQALAVSGRHGDKVVRKQVKSEAAALRALLVNHKPAGITAEKLSELEAAVRRLEETVRQLARGQ